MTQPTLILSFDCEGKWGMADRLSARHRRLLTTEKLEGAYRELVAMLQRHKLRATFAFVGLMTLSAEEFREVAGLFRDAPAPAERWLEPFWRDRLAGCTDGWLAPQCLEIVRTVPGHEIGAHGCTHTPIGHPFLSQGGFGWELARLHDVARLKGIRPLSFVYPRNLVAFTGTLAAAGFLGYRAPLRRGPGLWGRIAALAREANLADVSQPPCPVQPPDAVAIPSGYFLNWRRGIRRAVPRAVTVARWRRIRDHALQTGGVVHLWLHPHNLLDGDRQWELLECVLGELAPDVRAGRLANRTQEEYCQARLAAIHRGTTSRAAARSREVGARIVDR